MRKKKKIIGARHITWLAKDYFAADPAAGRVHTYEDLLNVRNVGGSEKDADSDIRNLALFPEKWDKTVGNMEQRIDSSLFEIHYLREIRNSFSMKDDVRDHDNAIGPKKPGYAWLRERVWSRLNRHGQNKNRADQTRTLSDNSAFKASAAEYRSRGTTPQGTPKTIACKRKGSECPYSHDPKHAAEQKRIAELRAGPGGGKGKGNDKGKGKEKRNSSNSTCRNLASSSCLYGEKCRFNHVTKTETKPSGAASVSVGTNGELRGELADIRDSIAKLREKLCP